MSVKINKVKTTVNMMKKVKMIIHEFFFFTVYLFINSASRPKTNKGLCDKTFID